VYSPLNMVGNNCTVSTDDTLLKVGKLHEIVCDMHACNHLLMCWGIIKTGYWRGKPIFMSAFVLQVFLTVSQLLSFDLSHITDWLHTGMLFTILWIFLTVSWSIRVALLLCSRALWCPSVILSCCSLHATKHIQVPTRSKINGLWNQFQ